LYRKKLDEVNPKNCRIVLATTVVVTATGDILAKIDTTTELATYKRSHRMQEVVNTFARCFWSAGGLQSPYRSGFTGRVAMGARFDTNKKRVIGCAIVELCCVPVVPSALLIFGGMRSTR
jgi:uncharacterized membrane protein